MIEVEDEGAWRVETPNETQPAIDQEAIAAGSK